MNSLGNRWTPTQCARAAVIFARETRDPEASVQAADRAVGDALGKSQGAVTTYRQLHGDDFQWSGARYEKRPDVLINRISPEQLAERDARKEAADRRDLTAKHCGDPPSGFSALDEYRRRLAAGPVDRLPSISAAAAIGATRDYSRDERE